MYHRRSFRRFFEDGIANRTLVRCEAEGRPGGDQSCISAEASAIDRHAPRNATDAS